MAVDGKGRNKQAYYPLPWMGEGEGWGRQFFL